MVNAVVRDNDIIVKFSCKYGKNGTVSLIGYKPQYNITVVEGEIPLKRTPDLVYQFPLLPAQLLLQLSKEKVFLAELEFNLLSLKEMEKAFTHRRFHECTLHICWYSVIFI